MGKTKTAFVGSQSDKELSGEEKYRLKQQKKQQEASQASEDSAGAKTDKPTEDTKKEKWATKRGKKYLNARAMVDKSKLYGLKDAIELVKKTSTSKFDATIELHLTVNKVGISATASLPNSTGSDKKIEFATEETIKKLDSGKIDFDVLLATAEMMPKLVPFARLLGPKGLMPNPKNGTVIKNKAEASKFNVDKVTLKTEKKAPVIHTVLGKVSMDTDKIIQNLESIISAIGKNRIVKAYLSPTMGPSVKLSL